MENQDGREIADRVVADVGGAFAAGLGYIGDRLGLFRMLASEGECSSRDLASLLELDERYVREWLKAMVSAGYIEARGERYFMTTAQQAVLADEGSALFAAGAFQFALPSLNLTSRLVECFRGGGGIPYRDLGSEIPQAIDRMHRPWFEHHLVQSWLPAVPGLASRLERGIRVLDLGCGLGRAGVAIGRRWPNSRVTGIDPDGASIEEARRLGAASGVSVEFIQARLKDLGESDAFGHIVDFDLIVAIDCIHDMADPVAELRAARQLLSASGMLFWSEPRGSRNPMENRAPVEKMRATLSPYHCLTVALAEGGRALGTIIGEDGARELAREAGFGDFELLGIESRMQQFFVARKGEK